MNSNTEWSKSMLEQKKNKWEQGVYTGPHSPLGYRIVKEPYRHLEVEEDSSRMVVLIFDKIAKGMLVNDVVTYLNQQQISTPSEYVKTSLIRGISKEAKKLWTHKMLIRVLQNEIYIGNLVHDNKKSSNGETTIYYNAHEAIIDTEVFRKVSSVLNKGTYGNKLYKASDRYEGVLYCAECGRKLRRRKHNGIRADGSGNYIYYRCYNQEEGDYIIEGCIGISIEQKELEKQIEEIGWKFGEGELEVGLNATRTKVIVKKKEY